MRFLPIILLLTGLLAFSAPSWAAKATCTCAESSLENRLNRADYVFTGTVNKIKIIDKFVIPHVNDLPVEVSLDIDTFYKGNTLDKTFSLATSLTDKTCTGHPFIEGEKYLFFVYQRKEGTHETWSMYPFSNGTYDVGGLCGGTKKLSAATDDLQKLKSLPEKKEENSLEKLIKTP